MFITIYKIMEITTWQMILRLVIAVILGGIIGWERERRAKTAGLRTHILICLGSTLAMLISYYVYAHGSSDLPLRSDLSRIAAGVLQGIGLLCVASVLRYKDSVIGLSTSASLWTVSAVGLAVGAGFYSAAVVTVALIMIVLIIIAKIENRYIRSHWHKNLNVRLGDNPKVFERIISLAGNHELKIKNIEPSLGEDGHSRNFILQLEYVTDNHEDFIKELSSIDGVLEVRVQQEVRF